MTVLPVILWLVWRIDLTGAPGVSVASMTLSELAIMAVSAIIGWRIAVAIGLLGASFLGPLLLTAGLTLSGVIEHRPLAEAIMLAQFFIGIVIGAKYTGITLAEVRLIVTTGLGQAALLGIVAALFATAAHFVGLAPPLEAILAFAPGGQAEMAVLAIVAGADVAYVVVHHVTRITLVIVGGPLVFRWLR